MGFRWLIWILGEGVAGAIASAKDGTRTGSYRAHVPEDKRGQDPHPPAVVVVVDRGLSLLSIVYRWRSNSVRSVGFVTSRTTRTTGSC